MADRIQVRRGNKADLPGLLAGEPGLSLDSKQFYLGTNGTFAGNIAVATMLSGGSRVQVGSGSLTVSTAGAQVQTSITFPIAFSSVPNIFLTITSVSVGSGSYVNTFAFNASATSFFVLGNSGAAQSISFNWIAFGT